MSKNNLLKDILPSLLKEWDYEKNIINPNKITKFSNIKVYWKCSKGHSWAAKVATRVQNINCPYCYGRYATKENNLLIKFPEIVKEWDYSKNKLCPEQYTPYSSKKVHWKCLQGHSYEMSIDKRTYANRNCPLCSKYRRTSFGEQCIYYYLKTLGTINNYKFQNKEIDIYLPKEKIGIEFNGSYWHSKRRKKDKDKEKLFNDNDIKIFYICEGTKNYKYKNKIYFDYKHKYNKNLEWAINKLFNIFSFNINVNIEKDKHKIYLSLQHDEENKSVNNKLSYLLEEWNYKKNTISPKMISAGSGKKVWWVCSKGHSWEDSPLHRKNGRNCPYCSKRRLLKGFNDLLTTDSILIKEWDYDKNNITPDEIMRGSSKLIYWKCSNNHSWKASPNNRTNKHSGCPECNKINKRKKINK